jgi:hypothetical protein
MVAFDATGNVRWVVPNEQPQIATADGGVVGQSGITYDQNGNATGQINLATQSWLGYTHQLGSVDQVLVNPVPFALSFWAVQGGNASGNGTAARPWYTPIEKCPPGVSTVCPQGAMSSALRALKTLLTGPCSGCDDWVFSKLPGYSRAGVVDYLSLTPRWYDGTQSYAPENDAFCPSLVASLLP